MDENGLRRNASQGQSPQALPGSRINLAEMGVSDNFDTGSNVGSDGEENTDLENGETGDIESDMISTYYSQRDQRLTEKKVLDRMKKSRNYSGSFDFTDVINNSGMESGSIGLALDHDESTDRRRESPSALMTRFAQVNAQSEIQALQEGLADNERGDSSRSMLSEGMTRSAMVPIQNHTSTESSSSLPPGGTSPSLLREMAHSLGTVGTEGIDTREILFEDIPEPLPHSKDYQRVVITEVCPVSVTPS